MTALIAYWKEIAIVLIIGGLLWIGKHEQVLIDKAEENVKLREQLEAVNTQLAKNDKLSVEYESLRAGTQKRIQDAINQWSKNHAKDPHDCPLPADARSLLKAGAANLP